MLPCTIKKDSLSSSSFFFVQFVFECRFYSSLFFMAFVEVQGFTIIVLIFK